MSDLTPHHRLSIHRRIGHLHLAVDLTLSADWTLLFGPSGSGKTSILRAACGLLPSAFVEFSRRNTEDTADTWQTLQNTSRSTPTHLRQLSWAPQQATLFPHLTVTQNIAFSLRNNSPMKQKNEVIDEALQLFCLTSLSRRLPRDLSGGERQRVNLARAFARPDSRLMLLDEPFTGIDRTLRNQILPELRAALRARNLPVLSVSHDVEEAFRLQCEVVKIRHGKVEAQGPAPDVLAAERLQTLQSLS